MSSKETSTTPLLIVPQENFTYDYDANSSLATDGVKKIKHSHSNIMDSEISNATARKDDTKDNNGEETYFCQCCKFTENEEDLFYCSICSENTYEISIFCSGCGGRDHRKKKHKFSKENIKSVDHICKKYQMTTNEFKTKFYNAILEYYHTCTCVNNTTNKKARKKAIAKIQQLFVETTSTTVALNGFSAWTIGTIDGILLGVNSGTKCVLNGLYSASQYIGAPVAAIVLPITWGLESCFWCYQYKKKRITKQELWFRITKGAIRTGGACGAGAGMTIAAGACVGVGSILLGIGAAIAAGIIISIAANEIWKYLTQKYPKWTITEIKHEQLLTDQALKEFKFTCDDIKNEKIFNKKSISKRYKGLAKTFHPDMGGDEAKFREIHAYYGILLAMVECHENENEKQHRNDAQELVKAIMWQ